MEYTKNYHLPQWTETDRILMEDFNAAMAGIEKGLTTEMNRMEKAMMNVAELQILLQKDGKRPEYVTNVFSDHFYDLRKVATKTANVTHDSNKLVITGNVNDKGTVTTVPFQVGTDWTRAVCWMEISNDNSSLEIGDGVNFHTVLKPDTWEYLNEFEVEVLARKCARFQWKRDEKCSPTLQLRFHLDRGTASTVTFLRYMLLLL